MCEEQLTFCFFVERFCETADGGAIRSAVTHRTGQPGQPSPELGDRVSGKKAEGRRRRSKKPGQQPGKREVVCSPIITATNHCLSLISFLFGGRCAGVSHARPTTKQQQPPPFTADRVQLELEPKAPNQSLDD
jgi:hypothetical protein